MIPPIAMRYEGDGVFIASHKVVADRHFVCGQRYVMAEHQNRSRASHNHFFACVRDAWMNLPEHLASQFLTDVHLRKWCLVKAGYCTQRDVVVGSADLAQGVAEAMRSLDEYAVILVVDDAIRVFTAQSQSVEAMGSRAFQESKDKVLEIAASLIGAQPDQLGRAA